MILRIAVIDEIKIEVKRKTNTTTKGFVTQAGAIIVEED